MVAPALPAFAIGGSSQVDGTISRFPTSNQCASIEACTEPVEGLFRVLNAAGQEVQRFQTNETGQFSLKLDPGAYRVVPDVSLQSVILHPSLQSSTLQVAEGQTPANTSIVFDTGIRAVIVGIDAEQNEQASFFELAPAYPNPFNPTTNFTLRLDVGQHVRLVLFDANGKQVGIISDRFLSSNAVHQFQIDARSLPSGIYFYQAMGDGFISQAQAVLLQK